MSSAPSPALSALSALQPAASPGAPETRRRLLGAALAVFGRYGYRRASMEAVAAEAGISRQRFDIPGKVDGSTRYGIDMRLPGMLFAAAISHLHDRGDAAGAEAAAAARAAGGGIAAVAGALIGARLAFYAAEIYASPHAAELLEESGRLGGPEIARRARRFRAALAAELARAGTRFADGLTAGDLADLLILATAGVKHGVRPGRVRAEAQKIVGYLLEGAAGARRSPRNGGRHHA